MHCKRQYPKRLMIKIEVNAESEYEPVSIHGQTRTWLEWISILYAESGFF